MLNDFIKSLGFLGVDASNTNHQPCDKYIYKFEDEVVNKHWLCFYAFYKKGRNEVANILGSEAIKLILP